MGQSKIPQESLKFLNKNMPVFGGLSVDEEWMQNNLNEFLSYKEIGIKKDLFNEKLSQIPRTKSFIDFVESIRKIILTDGFYLADYKKNYFGIRLFGQFDGTKYFFFFFLSLVNVSVVSSDVFSYSLTVGKDVLTEMDVSVVYDKTPNRVLYVNGNYQYFLLHKQIPFNNWDDPSEIFASLLSEYQWRK